MLVVIGSIGVNKKYFPNKTEEYKCIKKNLCLTRLDKKIKRKAI